MCCDTLTRAACREAAGRVEAANYKLSKVEAALSESEARLQELEGSFDARVAAALQSQLDARGQGTDATSALEREVERYDSLADLHMRR